ncbi:hypothetical protein WA026_004953 [Henosepilachna vigintioctopunctata]|uniref:Methyltransferase HEMK2 n=1 Tax=Henosepilachna vigintioctopunctata TaxID=420089 RepID=A0AAW1UMJ2_9CUCU
MKLATPTYDLKNYSSVYEPREDTFLLLDALELENVYLKNLKPLFALEIGSGSGVIISSLSFIFEEKCLYFATDINPEACLATLNTASLNKCNVEVLNTDLSSGFINGIFDLLIFNPPYVITESEEYYTQAINKSWAGGNQGREVIDKFLRKLPEILSKRGICYLLLLKANDLQDVSNVVGKLGFKSKIILERKIIGEYLFVMKINR